MGHSFLWSLGPGVKEPELQGSVARGVMLKCSFFFKVLHQTIFVSHKWREDGREEKGVG